MNEKKYKSGQKYYTADGHEVMFVGYLDGTPYVQFLVQDEYDDDAYPGEPRPYSRELFEKPPVAKVDEVVANKQAMLLALDDEEMVRRERLAELQAQIDAFAETTKEHEDFRLLADYLDGKISHVVAGSEYSVPKIMTLAKFLEGHDDRETWQRAVGLFAIPGKRPQYSRSPHVWRASQYWDGSGSWYEFTPCYSEEDARNVVRNIVSAELSDWRENGQPHYRLTKSFETHDWLDAPADWLEYVRKTKEESLTAARDKAKKELAEAEKGMKEIQR